jgi:hypothetical protein
MQYETFELRIQPGHNKRFAAVVTRSLAGLARGEFTLPFAEEELAAFLWQTVQQCTRSLWGSQPEFGYPYDPADGREVTDPAKLPAPARLVHRGGSFKSAPAELRGSARGNYSPDGKSA